jgi:hypothetical protein
VTGKILLTEGTMFMINQKIVSGLATMVCVVPTTVNVVLTMAKASLTTVFVPSTIVYVVPTAVFVILTTVSVVPTMVFVFLTLVSGVEKIFSKGQFKSMCMKNIFACRCHKRPFAGNNIYRQTGARQNFGGHRLHRFHEMGLRIICEICGKKTKALRNDPD